MREVLHDEDGLVVALETIEEGLRAVLESDEEGPDLTVDHEVVVIVDGRGRPVEVEGSSKAWADLGSPRGDWTLMVRVHEFYEGWDITT